MARSIAISPIPATGSTGQPATNTRRRDALTRQRVAETIASSPNAARIERLIAWLKNLGQSEAGEAGLPQLDATRESWAASEGLRPPINMLWNCAGLDNHPAYSNLTNDYEGFDGMRARQ
jgi:hypothetical protein